MKKIINVLNGNKSIICLALISLLGTDAAIDAIPSEFLSILKDLVLALTGGALAHHGLKGKFGSDSN